jgi:hypothetical protein
MQRRQQRSPLLPRAWGTLSLPPNFGDIPGSLIGCFAIGSILTGLEPEWIYLS